MCNSSGYSIEYRVRKKEILGWDEYSTVGVTTKGFSLIFLAYRKPAMVKNMKEQ